MNLLLDTNVLIWTLENNPRLSGSAREAIVDGENLEHTEFWVLALQTL